MPTDKREASLLVRGVFEDDHKEKKAAASSFTSPVSTISFPTPIIVDASSSDHSGTSSPWSSTSSTREEDDEMHPSSYRVRFLCIENMDEPWTSPLKDAQRTPDELLETLQHLRQRLTQTQIDLSAEKALRKRKEKNLIKIARELVLRAAQGDAKDAQIIKVRRMLGVLLLHSLAT